MSTLLLKNIDAAVTCDGEDRLLEGAEHAGGAKAVQERGGRADDEIFENGWQCEHI